MVMKNIRYKWVVLIILLLVGYLGFMGLGHVYFWDDESLVGITAKSFLETGKFSAWDGVNLYAYRNGGMATDDLQINTPPLDVWVCALSYKLLGVSVITSRLLFVFAGLMALLFFALILDSEFPDEDSLKIFMLLSVGFSTLFLLNIRQCRYNALAMMSSLGCFYFYLQSLKGKTAWPFIGMGLMAAILFYANSMLCAGFLVSLGLMHLVYHRREYSAFHWKAVTIAIFGFLALTVPYAVAHRIWNRHDFDFIYRDPLVLRKIKLMFAYLRDMNLINALPWMLVAVLGFMIWKDKKNVPELDKIQRWVFLAVVNNLMIALLSPQPTNEPGYSDVRYLIVAYALLMGISGYILWLVYRKNNLAGCILLVLYIFTTFFTVIPFAKKLKITPYDLELKWLFPSYLAEIHTPYPVGYPVVADYLLKNVKPGEMVMIWPEHATYPIRYITDKKILFGCSLNQYTHLDQDKMRKLSPRIFLEDNYPDWFVAFGRFGNASYLLGSFQREHWEGENSVKYGYMMVKYIDYYWDQTQRPEIYWHHFGPKQDFSQEDEGIYIYKRFTLSVDSTLLKESKP
jgi:hypothetical protein